MTYAIDSTAHEELEYPEPSDYMAPDMAGDRARGIAAIHAYAEWLAQHPEVPLPNSVEGHVFQTSVERDASIETVRAFMREHGAVPHTSGETGWAILRLMDAPVKIEHTIFTGRSPRREQENWL